MKKITSALRSLPFMGTIIALGSVCSWQVSAANAQTKFDKSPSVIYGEDDRRDVYEAQKDEFRELASSTVALLQKSSLSEMASGFFKIKGEQYGASMGLCSTERFFTQTSAAFCSGSLIAPNLIMTAGHCVRSEADCKNIKFVFGFALEKEGVINTEIAPEDVASCKKLVKRVLDDSTMNDYAIIEIEKPVTHRKALKLSKADPAKGSSLVVIGHPSGLPTKITDGANVRNAKAGEPYFVANLDTYGGNSGSAVFNASTGTIDGILVRGETDFVSRNGCRISYVCENDKCRGEDVTKVTEVRTALTAAGINIDAQFGTVTPPRPTPRPTQAPRPTRRPAPRRSWSSY